MIERLELPVAAIVVGERVRKEMGDIDKLAQNIDKIGLIHPIPVDMQHRLIAGQRRLEAAKRLGWTTIPVRIIDMEELILGEHAENEMRKDFTESERVAIKRAIEAKIGNRQGQRTDLLPDNSREVETGTETAEFAAKAAGFGSEFTARQVECVVDHGAQELIDSMDKGEVSPSAAAEVARFPVEDQKAIVAQGPKAVRSAAKAQREERRSTRAPQGSVKAAPEEKKRAKQESTEKRMQQWERDTAAYGGLIREAAEAILLHIGEDQEKIERIISLFGMAAHKLPPFFNPAEKLAQALSEAAGLPGEGREAQPKHAETPVEQGPESEDAGPPVNAEPLATAQPEETQPLQPEPPQPNQMRARRIAAYERQSVTKALAARLVEIPGMTEEKAGWFAAELTAEAQDDLAAQTDKLISDRAKQLARKREAAE